MDVGCVCPGESYLDHHSLALSRVMQCCLDGEEYGQQAWWAGRNTRLATCRVERCGARKAPEVRVRLQPCSQHLATVGGTFVEECPVELDEPEVSQAMLLIRVSSSGCVVQK
eukprot:scaffold89775_cov45-Prasinocladus_malaysianus.AAC.1